MSTKPKAVFLLSPGSFDAIYGPGERKAIADRAEVIDPLLTEETWMQYPEVTQEAEWIFSGWGMPLADECFLKAFPKLRTLFYGAGTIKGFVTEAFWERGITVTSAYAANAVPVAEFTVAQIVLSLKSAWRFALQAKREKRHPSGRDNISGVYDVTIGLISLGMIGRMVVERLRAFHVNVIAYDPFLTEEAAQKLGVQSCSLEEIFARADVVSCHTPWLKETEGMLRKEHFSQMKQGATFINTARGAVVNEPDLIEVLTERPDLFALLDVTWPEPPVAGSPFYELPNVVLTPHIAGSLGNECHRMAQYMIEEADRVLANEPLRHAITREQSQRMA